MNSHIHQVNVRGKQKFELTINHPPRNGKRRRERRWFDTQGEAETAQSSSRQQYEQTGHVFASLSPLEQADAVLVMAEARSIGTTLRGLLDYYKSHAGIVRQRTTTLREMIDITIQTKTTSGRRQRYVNGGLKSTLEQFAKGRESMPLCQVSSAMITDFLASRTGRNGGPPAGSTKKGIIARLGVMFSIATKNEAYLDSSANPMKNIEKPYVPFKPPVIMSPEDAARILWVCRVTDPGFLPYIVLGMFTGIRPEELEKVRWRDIHMEENEIVIEDEVAKHFRSVRRARRVFSLEKLPLAKAWLEECKAMGLMNGEYIFECGEVHGDRLGQGRDVEKRLRSIKQTVRRHRQQLCKRAGVKWYQDILRKTACSYLMWKFEEEGKVSAILGNSPDIVFEHYRGLLRRRDGEAFENLTPANVKKDPIELPKGGQGKKAGVLIPQEKTQ